MRPSGRTPDQMRLLQFEPGFTKHAEGACLVSFGETRVLVTASVATVVWALALRRWTNAVIPWRDAFIAAFSVAAQVLQARKNLETWPLWVIVNLMAIPSYWSASLAYSAFLYLIYLGLAFEGWREWHRAMKMSSTHV